MSWERVARLLKRKEKKRKEKKRKEKKRKNSRWANGRRDGKIKVEKRKRKKKGQVNQEALTTEQTGRSLTRQKRKTRLNWEWFFFSLLKMGRSGPLYEDGGISIDERPRKIVVWGGVISVFNPMSERDVPEGVLRGDNGGRVTSL